VEHHFNQDDGGEQPSGKILQDIGKRIEKGSCDPSIEIRAKIAQTGNLT